MFLVFQNTNTKKRETEQINPSQINMILQPIVHASLENMAETVHALKAQVAAQNRHLTNKVTSLESKVTSLESKVAFMDEMNNALTIRVALLEHIAKEQLAIEKIAQQKLTDEQRAIEKIAQQKLADEQRAIEKIADEMRAEEQRAKEKLIADRCAEVVKKNSEYPLHQAALDGESNEVLDHFILNRKIHVNSQGQNGFTPLHLAADKGQYEAVRMLIATGSDRNCIASVSLL